MKILHKESLLVSQFETGVVAERKEGNSLLCIRLNVKVIILLSTPLQRFYLRIEFC